MKNAENELKALKAKTTKERATQIAELDKCKTDLTTTKRRLNQKTAECREQSQKIEEMGAQIEAKVAKLVNDGAKYMVATWKNYK